MNEFHYLITQKNSQTLIYGTSKVDDVVSFLYVCDLYSRSNLCFWSHSSFIDLTNFSNGSSGIYMLIIGILTTSSFFYYYMQQGATRKNFFLAR